MKALLQRLADNVQPDSEEGWEEDVSDRTVKVTKNSLLLKGTFEFPNDDRGGRHRVEVEFTVEGDSLVETDSEDRCPLVDEKKLQQFVNEHYSFQPG